MTQHTEQQSVYSGLWTTAHDAQWETLKTEATPRSPAVLYDLVAESGLQPGEVVVDVGCGRGDYACELARRFHVYVHALDPESDNVAAAQQAVEAANLAAQMTVTQGVMEKLPQDDATVTLIWARGVVAHVEPLAEAFGECYRVLKPNGAMVLLDNYATERMATPELAQLRELFGFAPQGLDRSWTEAAIQTSGLTVSRSLDLSSEFAEFYEAQSQRGAKALLNIALLHRLQPEFTAHFGPDAHRTHLAMSYWRVYQLLGKVGYQAYLLTKPSAYTKTRMGL